MIDFLGTIFAIIFTAVAFLGAQWFVTSTPGVPPSVLSGSESFRISAVVYSPANVFPASQITIDPSEAR